VNAYPIIITFTTTPGQPVRVETAFASADASK
jgi:hypothetical protein